MFLIELLAVVAGMNKDLVFMGAVNYAIQEPLIISVIAETLQHPAILCEPDKKFGCIELRVVQLASYFLRSDLYQ